MKPQSNTSITKRLMLLFCSVVLLSGVGCGKAESKTLNIAVEESVKATNVVSGAFIHSGFIVGTASSKDGVRSVDINIDDGGWQTATGTEAWSFQLPHAAKGNGWKLNSTHNIRVRANTNRGDVAAESNYTIKRGLHRDFNGDGHPEIVIAANLSDEGGLDLGSVYIYHGGPAELSRGAKQFIPYPETDLNARFGSRVASAGDVNGDGYADLIVGALLANIEGTDRGVAYVFHGSAMGLSVFANQVLTYPGSDDFAYFGGDVSSAGDVNGDGYDDIIVGAYLSDLSGTNRGAAYLYLGSVNGVSSTPSQTLQYPLEDDNASYGYAVSGGGDLNADGFCDLIVGAYLSDAAGSNRGAAYIYHGKTEGISTTPNQTILFPGDHDAALFAHDVGIAGDVNGDAFDDIIIGAPFVNNGQLTTGSAYVYHGSESGIGALPNTVLRYPSTDNLPRMGIAVSRAGDVNQDGLADIIVGADFSDLSGINFGAAFIFHGEASGIQSTPNQTILYTGPDFNAGLGTSVSGAGDFDGDGFGDVIVGAYIANQGGPNNGAVYLHSGSTEGISNAVAKTFTYTGRDSGAQFGVSIY